MQEFGAEALRRYSRQMLLAEVGGAGQRRLREARALVVGLGALGSPVVLYLAAAGVGTLGLADHDRVELSNLGRQVLYDVKDLERPKVACARARVEALNPDVRVVTHQLRVEAATAPALVAGYQVVVECSDSLETKLAVNAAGVAAGVPLVIGAAAGWEGQVLLVRPGTGPCYRCVYGTGPPPGAVPTCEAAGILGAVAGVVGSLQAVAALRLCLGLGATAAGELWVYDGATGEVRAIRARRRPDCPACAAAGVGGGSA